MSRPPFEVADIIRISGDSFRQRYSASLTWPQRKVLDAIVRCRTAALGGHRDACADCGHQAISYNSCRNRHCPKCQTGARDQWLRKRQQELLAVGYYHLVFSVPHMLVPLMWQNKRQLFSLLFEASAATLLDVAADPKHLGAQPGFLSILHTWGQTLTPHPHIHCVVPGGGLAPDHTCWISAPSNFLLPVKVLSRVFRGKFLAGLRRLFARHQLRFFGECMPLHEEKHFALFLRTLYRQDWSSMPNRPSVALSTCCITWHAIPIASPSPTIACSRSQLPRFASAGRTMLTKASSARCYLLPKSSCAASSSMSCREAFPVSATSASSLTADEPACCHSAVTCSTRLLPLRLLPPHSPPRYGSAHTAMDACISSNGSRPHNSSSLNEGRQACLTLPNCQSKTAFTACFAARLLEVCLRPENGAFRPADAVFRILFGIPHEWPHRGSPLTLHACSCCVGPAQRMKTP